MEKIKFSKTALVAAAERYQLADIYLFGSNVTGFQREESDFDIGVRFKNGLPNPKERSRIYGDLFSDFSSIFRGEKIDLTFIEEVPLHFQFKIVTEGKLIYAKAMDEALNFLENIANRYRDYKYFIDEYFQGVLARKI